MGLAKRWFEEHISCPAAGDMYILSVDVPVQFKGHHQQEYTQERRRCGLVYRYTLCRPEGGPLSS